MDLWFFKLRMLITHFLPGLLVFYCSGQRQPHTHKFPDGRAETQTYFRLIAELDLDTTGQLHYHKTEVRLRFRPPIRKFVRVRLPLTRTIENQEPRGI